MPPEDTSAETEEDLDDSNEESANPNHLSRGILNQVCDVRYDDSDFDEADNHIPLSVIRRNLPSTSSKKSSSTASKHEVAPKRKKFNWSEDIPSIKFITQDVLR